MDPRDYYQRHLKELELAMALGHTRIIVEPQEIAEFCSYYIRFCRWTQDYAYLYGISSIALSLFWPKKWYLYIPCFYFSICNAYAHSRFARTDRFHRYTLIETDEMYGEVQFEPQADDVDPEEIEHPDQYPSTFWVLKREG